MAGSLSEIAAAPCADQHFEGEKTRALMVSAGAARKGLETPACIS